MAQKQLVRDLTSGSIVKTLYRLAVPVMVANLLQTVYNMADMMIVGQVEGSAGLSAVSIGGDLMHFFTFLGMGFATAGQIMVSQYVGAGKRDELGKVIGTLFTFLFLTGAALSVIGVAFAEIFLGWLHTPQESLQGALSYTTCCGAGLILIFGYNAVSAVLRGMGDSRHPMLFISLAAILNILLDLLFVAQMKMGALGAALATVISQGLSLILCIGFLMKHSAEFGFDFRLKSFRVSRKPMLTILRLGIPIAIQTSAGSISGLYVASHVNGYGVVASAVTGAGNKLSGLALIVANALNTSGSSVIGQSFGAGKIERVKKTFYTIFISDLIFVSLLSIGILTFPEQVFGLFDQSPEVLAMSHKYAPVAAIAFMGFSVRSPSLALINGLGQSRINFLMGITEGLILRIGLTYLFGIVLNLGLSGFWYGSVIASYGYGLVVFPYFFSGKWKKLKNLTES